MMPSTCKEDLREQGFCIARNRFDQATLDRIGRLCDTVLESVTENHRKMFKAQGSLVDIMDYPDFAEIIAHPALGAVRRAGIARARLQQRHRGQQAARRPVDAVDLAPLTISPPACPSRNGRSSNGNRWSICSRPARTALRRKV
jgi:hypothetical protein